MFPDEEPKKTRDMSEKKNPSDGFGGGVSGKMAEGGVGWGGRGGDEKGAGRNHIGEGRSEVEGREGKEKAGKTGRDKKKKGGGRRERKRRE